MTRNETSTRPIRVGLVGTGFGTKVQAHGFRSVEGFALAGVASGRMENARKAADEFGIAYATDDWRRLLAECDLDLVSVVTPVDLHHPIAMEALRGGKHVLCEKPFAMHAREAREMAYLARERGLLLAVNHEFRHFPGRTTMVRLLQEGAIGDPVHFVIRDYFPLWARNPARRFNWLSEKRRGGGILGAIGSHHVDALRTRGGEIQSVLARIWTIAGAIPDAMGIPKQVTADDAFQLLLRFENGATGMVDVNGGAAIRRDRHEVHGTRGSLILEDPYTLVRLDPDGKREVVPIPNDLAIDRTDDNPLLAPFRIHLRNLRDAVRGDRSFSPDGMEGIRIQEVLDAARCSSDEGREITVRG